MLAVGAVTVTVTELALELGAIAYGDGEDEAEVCIANRHSWNSECWAGRGCVAKGDSGSCGLSPGVGQCLAIGVR